MAHHVVVGEGEADPAVRGAGFVLYVEDNVDLPWASFLYAASLTHCMAVSLGQGGEGLGTVWGVQTAERMLHEAGFTSVVRHEFPDDPFNAYFVAT